MTRSIRLPVLLCIALVFGSGTVLAETPQAYATCIACHGAAGEGNAALSAPALAGQDARYLERQLHNFKSGIRGSAAADTAGAQMRAMAMTIAQSDIAPLAAYLAALPPPRHEPAAGADIQNGNNYYQSKCGACHGGKAQGNPGLNAPALANLDAAYLERQVKNFQRGLRGSHADDKYGRQMKMMSTALPTDKDLADVIAFIQMQAQAD